MEDASVAPRPDHATARVIPLRPPAGRCRRAAPRSSMRGVRVGCVIGEDAVDLFGIDESDGGCRAAGTGDCELLPGDAVDLSIPGDPGLLPARVVRVERGPFGRFAVAFAYTW